MFLWLSFLDLCAERSRLCQQLDSGLLHITSQYVQYTHYIWRIEALLIKRYPATAQKDKKNKNMKRSTHPDAPRKSRPSEIAEESVAC